MAGASSHVVSFIIPTWNEERRIARCLDSILKQERGGYAIEVLVADACSADGTAEVVRRCARGRAERIEVLENPDRIAEFGKARALEGARGAFLVLLDADNEIVHCDWMVRMLEGLAIFPGAVGAESHYLPKPGESALNRYLTGCLHISDPLAHGIAARPREQERLDRGGTTFRRFSLPPGYPCGANGFVYRRDRIERFIGERTFEEGQVTLALALEGDASFVMADGYGVRHDYADSFGAYLRKRQKIALKHTTRSRERTSWVAYTGWRRWVVPAAYATGVAPAATSLVAAVRDRNPYWLLHGPMCFATTWVYAWNALTIRLHGKRAW